MKLCKYPLLLGLLFFTQILVAQNVNWPREILFSTGGKAIIYQPQPDELKGNILKGHGAVGVRETSTSEMVFGAVFFDAILFTDKESHIATIDSLSITNAKFTGVDDEAKVQKLIELIKSEVMEWDLQISLEQITATLRRQHPNYEVFNNTPPEIIYREKPTSLVILDGEPQIKNDKDLNAERVINSPYLIFKEGNLWNMYVGGVWYKSATVTDGWTVSRNMSAKVKSIDTQIKKQEKEQNDNKDIKEKPEETQIIIRTKPTELIQTDGPPNYKSIDSTTLQYAVNTTNDIIKTGDGTIFILIAGRWYKSSSLNGPWVFNESDKLPEDFSKIPEGSEKDNVLVSVSGTEAAEDAIVDAEIPQTAKVDRKTATVKVEYDGNPQFEKIEGTSLELALNANLTILKETGGDYFALDNGAWFIGKGSNGPWKVADRRPADIEKIPAKSAAYNSKYVYLYEITDEYVIMGYTGGYLGNYVQGDPTIIFGTGYYYRPWYGTYYYPRPCTWGYGFSYNPWTGWSMNFGYNVGFIHFGFGIGGSYWGGGYGGWFGPPLYRPPYRPPYYGGGGYYGNRPWNRPGGGGGYYGNRPNRPNIGNNNNINININNNHNNLYRPGGNKPGVAGTRPGISNRPPSRDKSVSIKNRPAPGGTNRPTVNNRPAVGTRPAVNGRPAVDNRPSVGTRPSGNTGPGGNTTTDNRKPTRPSKESNNVFADRDGNIYQRDNKGNINQRDKNGWNKPSNPQVNDRMKRDVQQRDRSNQNMQNFNRAKTPVTRPAPSRPPASRPATRPAGGGGGAKRGR